MHLVHAERERERVCECERERERERESAHACARACVCVWGASSADIMKVVQVVSESSLRNVLE